MLSDIIRDQLNKKMLEKNYNINSLALSAGLTPTAVRMFQSGKIKSPNIETLYKLAEFLNCSLDELTGRKKFVSLDDKKEFPWVGDLYKEIVDIAYPYIEEKNYNPTFSQTLGFIKEAYIFSIDKNNSKPDEKFIKWIIDKNMDDTLL